MEKPWGWTLGINSDSYKDKFLRHILGKIFVMNSRDKFWGLRHGKLKRLLSRINSCDAPRKDYPSIIFSIVEMNFWDNLWWQSIGTNSWDDLWGWTSGTNSWDKLLWQWTLRTNSKCEIWESILVINDWGWIMGMSSWVKLRRLKHKKLKM